MYHNICKTNAICLYLRNWMIKHLAWIKHNFCEFAMKTSLSAHQCLHWFSARIHQGIVQSRLRWQAINATHRYSQSNLHYVCTSQDTLPRGRELQGTAGNSWVSAKSFKVNYSSESVSQCCRQNKEIKLQHCMTWFANPAWIYHQTTC